MHAGTANTPILQARGATANPVQTAQIENSGTKGYAGAVNNTEVVIHGEQTAGEDLRLRGGSQWVRSQNPSGSVPKLEGNAGRNSGGQETGNRPRNAETSVLSYGSEVSAAELGISVGSQHMIKHNKDTAFLRVDITFLSDSIPDE